MKRILFIIDCLVLIFMILGILGWTTPMLIILSIYIISCMVLHNALKHQREKPTVWEILKLPAQIWIELHVNAEQFVKDWNQLIDKYKNEA